MFNELTVFVCSQHGVQKKHLLFGIALLFIGSLLSQPVYAVPPATLDTTFGSNGISNYNISNSDDEILAIAVQSDNKIIAVGYSDKPRQFAIVRYNPNGTLDSSFGTNGLVKIVFNGDDIARAVALQSDGKIVVAGQSGQQFALARLSATGQLDLSFGNNGKVVTTIGNSSNINSIAIQSDGKIVAAGYTEKISDFAVARYNTNGSLDSTFGTSGIVTTDFDGNDIDQATSIGIQSDGKIVAAGLGTDADLNLNFALVRYNTNGSYDTTFNGSGKVLTNVNNFIGADALAIQSDGKLVLSGSYDDIYLARYNSDGSLDINGFGNMGIVSTNIGGSFDSARSLAIESSGKILVGGSTISSGNEDFFTARYLSNGALDSTFDNGDGVEITSLTTNSDIGHALAIQPNRGIIVAGSRGDFGAKEFAMIRYVGNQATAATATVSGRITNPSGTRGIASVSVVLTDGSGNTSYALTNSLGYYNFYNVPVGQSYVITPNSTKYAFTPNSLLVTVMENYTGANFTAE